MTNHGGCATQFEVADYLATEVSEVLSQQETDSENALASHSSDIVVPTQTQPVIDFQGSNTSASIGSFKQPAATGHRSQSARGILFLGLAAILGGIAWFVLQPKEVRTQIDERQTNTDSIPIGTAANVERVAPRVEVAAGSEIKNHTENKDDSAENSIPKEEMRERTPTARRDREPTRRSKKSAKTPGFLSIDSSPYATITLNGKSLGNTPVIKHKLPSGTYKGVATSADGTRKRFSVTVRSGKTTLKKLSLQKSAND